MAFITAAHQTPWCRAFFEEALDFFPGKEIPDFD
jgi:hypothetical protein